MENDFPQCVTERIFSVKKVFALILVLGMLLCGCTAQPAETTVPTTQATVPVTEAATEEPTAVPTEESTTAPTQEATTAPTEPSVLRNPLTGEILDEPQTSRIFACSINNVPAAMPMHGVGQADIFFEMFVNDYCTRGLALFSDISAVEAVGSLRSLRYNFTDLCQTYDAIVLHVSGSNQVLKDLAASGVPNLSAENDGGNYSFRDQSRINAGYAWEHCLFARGQAARDYAESRGIRVTREEHADYGLRFTQDGTPAQGEDAGTVTINLIHDGVKKQNLMRYDREKGGYLFHQFGQLMIDGASQEPIIFENVIVMFCTVENESVYHIADLIGSGEGYFACGGKIIPIRWTHEAMDKPIVFTLADGTPLELGVGSSYIAIAPLTSTVEWE